MPGLQDRTVPTVTPPTSAVCLSFSFWPPWFSFSVVLGPYLCSRVFLPLSVSLFLPCPSPLSSYCQSLLFFYSLFICPPSASHLLQPSVSHTVSLALFTHTLRLHPLHEPLSLPGSLTIKEGLGDPNSSVLLACFGKVLKSRESRGCCVEDPKVLRGLREWGVFVCVSM